MTMSMENIITLIMENTTQMQKITVYITTHIFLIILLIFMTIIMVHITSENMETTMMANMEDIMMPYMVNILLEFNTLKMNLIVKK